MGNSRANIYSKNTDKGIAKRERNKRSAV